MIAITKGRYWDLPWSLVDGCTPCSPGCDHCWSAGIAHRFYREGEPGHCTGILTDNKGGFNGDIVTHPERLSIPLKRRKPTVYAIWNDLFHERVQLGFRDEAYSVMGLCRQHIFLVLTKRPSEMARYWDVDRVDLGTRWYVTRRYRKDGSSIAPRDCGIWPETGIPNIYHGLTVCNQAEADEKIPIFLQVLFSRCRGKKFISIEPMLGAVDLRGIIFSDFQKISPLTGEYFEYGTLMSTRGGKIDAVILGGETGPGARPMHPDWVRSVRDQCAAAGVPFFFKGWGEWVPAIDYCNRTGPGQGASVKFPWSHVRMDGSTTENGLELGKNASLYGVLRAGRKVAGRLLDGRTQDALPWVR